MASEFRGIPSIKQVSQPEGSELCFAAIVSSVADQQPVDQVHQSLVDGHISETNGHTSCPSEAQELQLADGETLRIEPFVGFDSETFMTAISKRLGERKGVALLHKKNDDEDDDRHHWTLLAGQYQIDGDAQLIVLMDPLQTETAYVEPSEVSEMIERTIEFNGGVYACALSIEPV